MCAGKNDDEDADYAPSPGKKRTAFSLGSKTPRRKTSDADYAAGSDDESDEEEISDDDSAVSDEAMSDVSEDDASVQNGSESEEELEIPVSEGEAAYCVTEVSWDWLQFAFEITNIIASCSPD